MTWSEYEKTALETSRLFIRATDIKSDCDEMYKWTFDEDFQKFWRLPKFSSKEDFEMYLYRRKKQGGILRRYMTAFPFAF